MSYIGSSASPLPVNFAAVQAQSFNGTGSQTAFTLSRTVPSAASIEVLVNNVQQSPYDGSYSVSGTTLTFSEAPSSGTNNVYVVYRDQSLGSLVDATAYRKAEVDSAVAAKVNKAGDTMTGVLTSPGFRSDGSGALGGAFDGSTGPGNFAIRARAKPDNSVAILQFTDNAATAQWGVLNSYESGGISAPYQPFYMGRDISAIYNGTAQLLVAHTSPFINRGNHYVNGTFTCPCAGDYYVATTFLTRAISGSCPHNIFIKRNGSDWARGRDILLSGSENYIGAKGIIPCAAGDTLQVYIQCDTTVGDFYHQWNETTIKLMC